MRRHAKAPSVEPSRHRRILAALGATAVLMLAFAAAPALAVAPTVTMGTVSDVSYTSAKASGEIDPGDSESYYSFEYSIAGADSWSGFSFQGPLPANSGNQAVSQDFTGLQPGTEYEVRLAGWNFIDPQVFSAEPHPTFTTDPVGPPSVTIDPVTTFTDSSAHFEGEIDPEAPAGDPDAFDVSWHFECTPACPNLAIPLSSAPDPIEADSDPHTVEADASGLEPNTNYQVRLIASNAAGPVEAGPESFKTTQLAPEVQTLYGGELGTDSAILAGQVNPRNAPVTYQFEWGTDTSYGNVAPPSPEALGAANNALNVVTTPISGLEPGTAYHFRLVATNTETSAVAQGLDHTFTTLEPEGPPETCSNAGVRSQQLADYLLDCRAYELVSAGDKGSLSVGIPQGDPSISDDGNRARFTLKGTPGDAGANTSVQIMYAQRDPQLAWSSDPLHPPQLPRTERALSFVGQSSLDLGHTLIASSLALAPGGVHGVANGYLRDNTTGTYQLISSGELSFIGISSGSDAVVFTSREQLTDISTNPEFSYPYIWREGTVSLAAVLPDPDGPGPMTAGAAPFGAEPGAGPGFGTTERSLSRDGTRVIFNTFHSDPGAPGDSKAGDLYVRTSDGASLPSTVQANASQRTPADPAGPLPALYWSAEAEHGSKVLFTSCEKLTDDSTADSTGVSCAETETSAVFNMGDGRDLYLFDVETGELTDLTTSDPAGANVIGVVGSSEDLGSIYFVARGALAPGAQRGEPNLYLHRNGTIRFIATLSRADEANWLLPPGNSGDSRLRVARVTPNGDFAVFSSRMSLTGFDNQSPGCPEGRCQQLFRYSASNGELVCVSCSGGAPSGDVYLSHRGPGGSFELPSNLGDDGNVFFESPDALSPRDNNEKGDVYRWENGRTSLISSGRSPFDSYFLDANPSGDDVLFRTHEALIGADGDLVADIYEARVDGGFLEQVPPTPCSGDGCRNALTGPPAEATPATPSFSGSGNLKAQPPKCRKGKVKRKGRCVAKKPRKSKKSRESKKRASQDRRVSR